MVKVTIRRFEWDRHNIGHIALHGVVPAEVEEVCRNELARRRSKSHTERVVLIGKTQGGRILKIVLEPKDYAVWRVVTAHQASRKERKIYQHEIGGEKTA